MLLGFGQVVARDLVRGVGDGLPELVAERVLDGGEDFKENPTGTLVTIRCAPWHHEDKAALVGDAAHAVVPFYGQGMNAAFEDCVVFDECLAEFPNDRKRAFAEYFARRKPNADALADLAVHNFIEMRDKTASRTFRAKKKLDHALEGLLPGLYLPLYTMVSFTRIPYAEAARRAQRQDRIVYGVLLFLVVILLVLLLGVGRAWAGR